MMDGQLAPPPSFGGAAGDEDDSALQLPAGWESAVSRSTGETYYINSATGDSTYDRPTAPAPGEDEEEEEEEERGSRRESLKARAASAKTKAKTKAAAATKTISSSETVSTQAIRQLLVISRSGSERLRPTEVFNLLS